GLAIRLVRGSGSGWLSIGLQPLELGSLALGERRLGGPSASAHREADREGAGSQDKKRPKPEEQGFLLEAWLQKHKLAVAGHEVVADLSIGPPCTQLLADQNAQIVSELGIRLVDRLILAHKAAEFSRQGASSSLESGIGERLAGLDCIRDAQAQRGLNQGR